MSRKAIPNPTPLYSTRAEEAALVNAQNRTYSAIEYAAMLGVSRDTVYREAKATEQAGGVPAIRVGDRYVFARALVDAVLGIGVASA